MRSSLLCLLVLALGVAAARAEEQTCIGKVSIGYFVSRVGPCDFANSSPAYPRIVAICRDGAACEVRGEWRWTKLFGWTLDTASDVRIVGLAR